MTDCRACQEKDAEIAALLVEREEHRQHAQDKTRENERLREGVRQLRSDHERVHPCTWCDKRLAALAGEAE